MKIIIDYKSILIASKTILLYPVGSNAAAFPQYSTRLNYLVVSANNK
jgi:hypothetical protein